MSKNHKTFLLGLLVIIVGSFIIMTAFDFINKYIFDNNTYKTILFACSMTILINLINVGSALKVNEWIKNISEHTSNENDKPDEQ